jgi:tRNA modification GTPase
MYSLSDTIAAVSSPTSTDRVIVRISGPQTTEVLNQIFTPPIAKLKSGIVSGEITVDDGLKIDAKLYVFPSPHSYTGDDVAEIHIHTNPKITEALIGRLLKKGVRMAEPGEFTARAYFNGKIDLSQAEAINQIITSSNQYQLAAAEKLLAGRLAQTTAEVSTALLDLLSLIEAGIDFSTEDIEFIARPDAVKRLDKIKTQLEQLLTGSISYESVIDLPTGGIAGAPGAGKSSLLNKLLGRQRSIVSKRRKTTRDILAGELVLKHNRVVLFDCAGLMQSPPALSEVEGANIIDELAQQAAIEALGKSSLVIFCVDLSKPDWDEDIAIRKLINPSVLIAVATKADLIEDGLLERRLAALNGLFAVEFMATSAKTGTGIELLRDVIDRKIIQKTGTETSGGVAITARHRQAVTEAVENIAKAAAELKPGNDEIAAMMLRTAYQELSNIKQHIDEKILENIFSRFCIGK